MASTSTLKPSSAMEASRNWLEIPDELMVDIFQRLRTAEIIASARVCTTWHRICKNPDLWKVIDVQEWFDGWRGCSYLKRLKQKKHAVDLFDNRRGYYPYLENLTKQAVDLSCGELIDISLEGFGTDDLLDYIVQRSSKLKSLCLAYCNNVTISGLKRALKRAPQLEKLHMSYTSWMVLDIIWNCPAQLKSFKLDITCIYEGRKNDKEALAIAKNMPELRHLQLFGNAMTKRGLKAILNGCPHLESLDIRTCYNINIHGNGVKLCKERIKNFKGPQDSTENCGFLPRIIKSVNFDHFYDYGGFDYDEYNFTDDDDSLINYMIDDFTL